MIGELDAPTLLAKLAAIRELHGDPGDEPERIGFAYGTTGDAAESGEESFILEHRDDDSVWLTIRSLLQPHGGLRRLFAPAVRRRRRDLTTRELRALHPAYT